MSDSEETLARAIHAEVDGPMYNIDPPARNVCRWLPVHKRETPRRQRLFAAKKLAA